MQIFYVTLVSVIILLLFILPGFILGKFKMIKGTHLKTLSTILVYVLTPMMFIDSFTKVEFKTQDLINMGYFFIFTLILQIIFLMTIYFVLRKKYEDPKYRVFTVGSVMGNVGYFGLPIVTTIYPSLGIAACYSCIFTATMNILVFTFGVYALTEDKQYISLKKALINPTLIGLAIGVILYCCNVGYYINNIENQYGLIFIDKLMGAVNLLAKMSAPICMIILGARLSTVSFKNLWTRPMVYLSVVFKGIVFPLFVFVVVRWLPFLDESLKGAMVVLAAAPCGAIVLSLAEIHHAQEELAANTVLVTTLLSFITIPLVSLLLYI
jgi:predicted permease